ncbi:acetate/propionate family kinase [Amycolatopsis magusensis]|uniref:acetate/propionate family kinase n=1 Tax=Amycolatopsis magusensis TaxID=882444 RepID=UPI0024A8215E|nr:acetate/propionate family kinase [Amycolatopsis magusensis]MDI5975889.1 acetate/propionate family kinase [Amycolatopsis magusensis]
MRILTLNPGSSSLKASLVDDGVAHGWATWELAEARDDARAVRDALGRWADLDAVAVRFVHGGARKEPTLLDDSRLAALDRLVPLAPVHQPLSLAVARTVRQTRPELPVVACFDTAFHATLPEAAAHYPLPRAWTRQNRLRRYGFHGLSCQYAVRRAAELLGRSVTGLQLVCCHVGAGVSVTAVKNGHSVDTSMGFTPLEGAMMATRSGSVDPGLLLHVMSTAPMTPGEMADALNHRSGLAGMSGTNGDLRAVLAAKAAGEEDADLAYAVYLHRLRREIGAAAMSLDRLDALVFTGGVAEFQPDVIRAVAGGLPVLGVHAGDVTPPAGEDGVLSEPGAPVAVLTVVPREDLEIAQGAQDMLSTQGALR